MRALKVITLTLLIIVVIAPIVRANPYTVTINAVFDRLNSKNESLPDPGGAAIINKMRDNNNNNKTNNTSPIDEEENKVSPDNNTRNGSTIYELKPIPDSYQGSILERLRSSSVVEVEDPANMVDRVVTDLHTSFVDIVIGISPLILIIGIIMALFSKGRATSFLVMFCVLLLVAMFAPEIVKGTIGFITSLIH